MTSSNLSSQRACRLSLRHHGPTADSDKKEERCNKGTVLKSRLNSQSDSSDSQVNNAEQNIQSTVGAVPATRSRKHFKKLSNVSEDAKSCNIQQLRCPNLSTNSNEKQTSKGIILNAEGCKDLWSVQDENARNANKIIFDSYVTNKETTEKENQGVAEGLAEGLAVGLAEGLVMATNVGSGNGISSKTFYGETLKESKNRQELGKAEFKTASRTSQKSPLVQLNAFEAFKKPEGNIKLDEKMMLGQAKDNSNVSDSRTPDKFNNSVSEIGQTPGRKVRKRLRQSIDMILTEESFCEADIEPECIEIQNVHTAHGSLIAGNFHGHNTETLSDVRLDSKQSSAKVESTEALLVKSKDLNDSSCVVTRRKSASHCLPGSLISPSYGRGIKLTTIGGDTKNSNWVQKDHYSAKSPVAKMAKSNVGADANRSMNTGKNTSDMKKEKKARMAINSPLVTRDELRTKLSKVTDQPILCPPHKYDPYNYDSDSSSGESVKRAKRSMHTNKTVTGSKAINIKINRDENEKQLLKCGKVIEKEISESEEGGDDQLQWRAHQQINSSNRKSLSTSKCGSFLVPRTPVAAAGDSGFGSASGVGENSAENESHFTNYQPNKGNHCTGKNQNSGQTMQTLKAANFSSETSRSVKQFYGDGSRRHYATSTPCVSHTLKSCESKRESLQFSTKDLTALSPVQHECEEERVTCQSMKLKDCSIVCDMIHIEDNTGKEAAGIVKAARSEPESKECRVPVKKGCNSVEETKDSSEASDGRSVKSTQSQRKRIRPTKLPATSKATKLIKKAYDCVEETKDSSDTSDIRSIKSTQSQIKKYRPTKLPKRSKATKLISSPSSVELEAVREPKPKRSTQRRSFIRTCTAVKSLSTSSSEKSSRSNSPCKESGEHHPVIINSNVQYNVNNEKQSMKQKKKQAGNTAMQRTTSSQSTDDNDCALYLEEQGVAMPPKGLKKKSSNCIKSHKSSGNVMLSHKAIESRKINEADERFDSAMNFPSARIINKSSESPINSKAAFQKKLKRKGPGCRDSGTKITSLGKTSHGGDRKLVKCSGKFSGSSDGGNVDERYATSATPADIKHVELTLFSDDSSQNSCIRRGLSRSGEATNSAGSGRKPVKRSKSSAKHVDSSPVDLQRELLRMKELDDIDDNYSLNISGDASDD